MPATSNGIIHTIFQSKVSLVVRGKSGLWRQCIIVMSLLIRGPKNKYASRELLEHVVANFDILLRARA